MAGTVAFAYLGSALLAWRLWPWLRSGRTLPDPGSLSEGEAAAADGRSLGGIDGEPPTAGPPVTIIVPARNEASNLPTLLTSLKRLDYPGLEILVVNDRSTDMTAEIAASFGVRVLESTSPPPGWGGKNWACLAGARAASGRYFLFTDADTVHEPRGLRRVVEYAVRERLAMTSAIPYHRNPTAWERALGAFQVALLAVTAPFQKPRVGRVFAIGQYLLFERESYWRNQGHEAVRESLIEDIAFANLLLSRGERYGVFPETGVFSVRMYDSFRAFLAGWRRNFRSGLKASRPSASLEVFLIFSSWITPGLTALPAVLFSWGVLLRVQGRLGRFSFWSLPLIPFSIACFTWVTAVALLDTALGRPIAWRGRLYPIGRTGS